MTTTTPEPPAPTGPAAPQALLPDRRRGDHQAARLLKRLHFFAGIFCAPLILIAAVTGFLYAFAPTVERVADRDMLTTSAPAGATDADRVPVSDLVSTARAEHPELALAGIRLGGGDETTRVLFNDPSLPDSTTRAVFLDPWTGDVRGDSTQYGSSASLPLRQWIADGHRMAWLGEPGRLYSETAASWLGVLAVGGLVLWWQRHRTLRGMLRTGGRNRVRTMRRHGATGTVVAVGMIFLTVTGLTWSSVAGTNIGQWREQINWGTPSVSTVLPGATPPSAPSAPSGPSAGGAHAGHAGHMMHGGDTGGIRVSGLNAGAIDRVATTAEAELRMPVTLTPPSTEGEAWVATEDRVAYRLSNDSMAVDWATGAVSERLNFSDWPLAAQASAWLIQLHMGTLFGLPNQIVLGLLAAAIIAMICWGYAMWWKRRPRSGDIAGSLAPAPPRPRRSLPEAGTVVLVVALVVYGLIAPLFGITCLAFVVLSALWSALARRSTR